MTDTINSTNISSLKSTVSANDSSSKEEARGKTLTIEKTDGVELLEPGRQITKLAAGYATSSMPDGANDNILKIQVAIKDTSLQAGYSEGKGVATGNKSYIENDVTGLSRVSGALVAHGAATGNEAIVEENVTASFAENGSLYGVLSTTAASTATFKDNRVIIKKNAKVNMNGGSVFGAAGEENTTLDSNSVVVEEGAEVTGNIHGASGGTVTNTLVDVKGTVNGNIYGSRPHSGAASNTTVQLDNAQVNGNVTLVDITKPDLMGEGNVLTMNNSTVTGTIGTSNYGGGDIAFSGVNKVGSFHISWHPDSVTFNVTEEHLTTPVLTLTGENSILDGITLTINRSPDVSDGEHYQLIGLEGDATLSLRNVTVDENTTFVHTTWNIENFTLGSGETLDVRWGEDPVEPPAEEPDSPVITPDTDHTQTVTDNSKTLSESVLGTIAFVNQGAEFIADEGMNALVESSEVGQVTAFGAVHGGHSRYETGSYVDVDGYTLAVGASYKIDSNWVVGGFVEAGWAESESHVRGTKGDGDHDYFGVGVASRYEFGNRFYADGSVRIGRASTEFTGLYANDAARYDSDVFYSTAHIGGGYVFEPVKGLEVDVYGRYLVSYLDGDSVKLRNAYNDKLHIDSTVTHAVRVGARVRGDINEQAAWRFGLAYEHVADGDAESSVNGLSLQVPTLEGNTGIAEFAVKVNPSQTSPWSVNFGLKGYVGDREGVSGSALVQYKW